MNTPVDVIVLGLGYVGLPLAHAASQTGLRVVGYDISPAKVDGLNAGHSHIDDLTDDDVKAMLDSGFEATTDPGRIGDASTVVICVPTPLRIDRAPDLDAIEVATQTIAEHLHDGTVVILESTTSPGTTDEVVRPALEQSGLVAGRDFHLAFSPERIDPGNTEYGIRNTPKVVGGTTPECTEAASRFYSKFVDTVVPVKGTREAEMTKLLENTYRHINIALVNEMAVFCYELGIDLWDTIDAAATKPFGFQAFRPGPGVGGHCIPIDPNYLSYKVRLLGYPFRFVELAEEINARMPAYLTARVQRVLNEHAKPVKGSKILILGVTYKADISDERESPAQPIARRLLDLGADLRYHDPYVERWIVDDHEMTRVASLHDEVARADIVVLLQPHAPYDLDAITADATCLFDASGRLFGDNVERL